MNCLQEVAHIPGAPAGNNGRAVSMEFLFFGGFFQTEAEPIGCGDRDRYRVLPVPNLIRKLGQLCLLTAQNRGRRPQRMKPMIVKAVEGGRYSPGFAPMARAWHEADGFRCRCADKEINHYADKIGEDRFCGYLRRGFCGCGLPAICRGQCSTDMGHGTAKLCQPLSIGAGKDGRPMSQISPIGFNHSGKKLLFGHERPGEAHGRGPKG